ncbi:MAG TPA: hypothetical protein VE641_09400 [Chthoniobacterales bacterium]|nr:hypothetical protein [Chthoniobacterales bacterium]
MTVARCKTAIRMQLPTNQLGDAGTVLSLGISDLRVDWMTPMSKWCHTTPHGHRHLVD